MRRSIEFLCIGIGAALWLAGATMAGGRPDGLPQLTLSAVPITCLLAVAVLYPSPRRWAERVASGGLGGALACVAALALVRVLGVTTDWLYWPDRHVDVSLLGLLVLTAVIPGVIAGACVSARRGLALAGGFCGTLAALVSLDHGLHAHHPAPWGILALLGAGTLAGVCTGWLVARGR